MKINFDWSCSDKKVIEAINEAFDERGLIGAGCHVGDADNLPVIIKALQEAQKRLSQ